jgi:hypothetical protein
MTKILDQSKKGLLRFFKPKSKKQFVSELDFMINRGRQSHTAIALLVELRELNIEEEDELKIDFFFYTDSLEKSQKVAKEIKNLNYNLSKEISTNPKNLYEIAGRTTEMRMMHEILKKWAIDMCELGYKYDCAFDRWEIVTSSK